MRIATIAVLACAAASCGAASAHASRPQPRLDQRFFLSPSKNISCELDVDHVAATPQTQAFCQTIHRPQSVTLSAAGKVKICRGVNCLGNPPQNVVVLPYGSTRRLGPFVCRSRRSGMQCTMRRTGGGFSIDGTGVTRIRALRIVG